MEVGDEAASGVEPPVAHRERQQLGQQRPIAVAVVGVEFLAAAVWENRDRVGRDDVPLIDKGRGNLLPQIVLDSAVLSSPNVGSGSRIHAEDVGHVHRRAAPTQAAREARDAVADVPEWCRSAQLHAISPRATTVNARSNRQKSRKRFALGGGEVRVMPSAWGSNCRPGACRIVEIDARGGFGRRGRTRVCDRSRYCRERVPRHEAKARVASASGPPRPSCVGRARATIVRRW